MSRSAPQPNATFYQSYSTRASIPNTPPLAAYLMRLMSSKRSNLCLSADVQSSARLLELAEECGDYICILKTHADIVHDWNDKTIKGLSEIASRKKFLIFEDRKFGDIGKTVQAQYAAGTHRIASWAYLTNAHVFPGPSIITALKSAALGALAADNTSISTEITGGPGPPSAPLLSEDEGHGSDSSSGQQDELESHDAGDVSMLSPSSGGASFQDLRGNMERRKGSVVSVETTISSSAEYIGPQQDASATPPGSNSTPSSPGSPVPTLPRNAPLARGLLLLAQMSSEDNMLGPEYTRKCVEQAREHRDFVLGFIAQETLNTLPDDNFLAMTPGINLPLRNGPLAMSPCQSPGRGRQSRRGKGSFSQAAQDPSPVRNSNTSTNGTSSNASTSTTETPPWKGSEDQSRPAGDGLGQQYNTPKHAIRDCGSDVIIVGRGILSANDPSVEAERYRREGWSAYCSRIGIDQQPSKRRSPANSGMKISTKGLVGGGPAGSAAVANARGMSSRIPAG